MIKSPVPHITYNILAAKSQGAVMADFSSRVISGEPGLYCPHLRTKQQNSSVSPVLPANIPSQHPEENLFELGRGPFYYHYYKALGKNIARLIFFSGSHLRLS